jgi:hypothetical protein
LQQKGTWKLVEKPKNAIPILNKWVLVKKQNKEGNIIKYKAHLMVCSFIQHSGLDYDKTFSLVMCFNTIQALLAMVSSKKLQVWQLDVKGHILMGNSPKPFTWNNLSASMMEADSYACSSKAYMA